METGQLNIKPDDINSALASSEALLDKILTTNTETVKVSLQVQEY